MSDVWLRLSATASGDVLRRRVAERIRGHGVESVLVEDRHTLGGESLAEDEARWVCFFSAEDADQCATARALADELGAIVSDGRAVRVELGPYDDTSWRDGWKEWFTPARVSPRLAVRAPWAELSVPDGVHVLVIEPGMAFGTGLHETTRLCLETLDRRLAEACVATDDGGVRLPGVRTMLDVGAGSGVLSIAAARLGVERVDAIDIDAATPPIAAENAAVNGVGDATHFSATALEALDGRWSLVVANILGHILRAMAAQLCARVDDGGALVLSGLLWTELEETQACFLAADPRLRVTRRASLGEWALIELTALETAP